MQAVPLPALTPDQQALVQANTRLAYWVVHGLMRSGAIYRRADTDSLCGAAIHGLCVAAARYQSDRGAKFSTYAFFTIRAFVQAEARHAGAISLPARCTNRTSTPESLDLLTRLGTTLQLGGDPRHKDAGLPPGCSLVDPGPDPVVAAEEQDQATRLLRRLRGNERRVIRLRVLEGWTLKAIGQELGISKERVRQIQQTAMAKLRTMACQGALS